MSNRAKILLVRWVIHVMYMLCEHVEIFSQDERKELGTLTHELETALKNELVGIADP